ncbi:MAG: hypothetical protein R2748_07855 [Bryobacterales bacterium]
MFNRNRARAGYDRRQIFQSGFVYEPPVATHDRDAVSYPGGWQIGGVRPSHRYAVHRWRQRHFAQLAGQHPDGRSGR